jgi:hypothetical protein
MDDTTSHDRAHDSERLRGARDELIGQIRDRARWSSGLQAVADELELIHQPGELKAVFEFLLEGPDHGSGSRGEPWQ